MFPYFLIPAAVGAAVALYQTYKEEKHKKKMKLVKKALAYEKTTAEYQDYLKRMEAVEAKIIAALQE